MARLVPLYLDTQAYGIVLGAADDSTHLLKKPWGHGEPTHSTVGSTHQR